MFGIGTEELLLILVIALVVLGPERMPKLARDLGRMVGEFRKTSDDLRNEFLNADRIIDVAAASASTPPAAAPVALTAPAEAAATAATAETTAAPATALDVGVPLSAEALFHPVRPIEPIEPTEPSGSVPPAPLTEAAVGTAPAAPAGEAGALPPAAAPVDPDETVFDREARDAHERLHDPARARQAAAEGWKTPTDEAGTTDRWG